MISRIVVGADGRNFSSRRTENSPARVVGIVKCDSHRAVGQNSPAESSIGRSEITIRPTGNRFVRLTVQYQSGCICESQPWDCPDDE